MLPIFKLASKKLSTHKLSWWDIKLNRSRQIFVYIFYNPPPPLSSLKPYLITGIYLSKIFWNSDGIQTLGGLHILNSTYISIYKYSLLCLQAENRKMLFGKSNDNK